MKFLLGSIVVLISVFLTACDSSGDGGAVSPPTTMTGQVFDAEIANATVEVVTLDNQLLATSQTDASGNFSVTFSGQPAQVLKFVASEGSYFEQAGGAQVFLTNETLISYVDYEPSQEAYVPINVLTHMAAGIFEYQLEQGQGGNLAAVQAGMNQYAGFSVESTSMWNLSDQVQVIEFSAKEKASLFSAGVSQFVYDTLIMDGNEGNQLGSFYTSISYAQTVYEDAKFDGILNGIGFNGTTGMGSRIFSTNHYRDQLALAMIKFVRSDFNMSNLSVSEVFNFASSLSSVSGVSVLGSEPTNPISNISPTISNANPSSNQPVSGQTNFTFDVADFAGIKGLSFKFSDGEEQYTSNFENPVFAVDTTQFSDGPYDVVISATNIGNQTAIETYQVIVSNVGTTISNLNPGQNQAVRAVHTFSADVFDAAGIPSRSFFIDSELHNGLTTTSTGYLKSIDTSMYADGSYTFKVEATNSFSVTTNKENTFIIDNTVPTLSDLGFDIGDFLIGTVNINPTLTDANGIALASLFFDNQLLSRTLHQNSFDLVTGSYDEGDHTVKIILADTVGNINTIETPVKIDNQAPTVNIWYPLDGDTVTSGFTLRWTQDDINGWGDTPARLYVGGLLYGEILNDIEQRSININNRPAGNNVIEVVVTDATGKISSHSITVNFQP